MFMPKLLGAVGLVGIVTIARCAPGRCTRQRRRAARRRARRRLRRSLCRARSSTATASPVTTSGCRRPASCWTGWTSETSPAARRCSRRSCASCGPDRCPPRDGRARRPRTSTPSRRRSRLRSTGWPPPIPTRDGSVSRRLNRVEYVNAIRGSAAGAGDRRRGVAAQRHGRFRLRQQRRGAVDHPGADVPLHRGGDQDQPRRRRQPRQPAGHAGVPHRVRAPRPPPRRAHAVRHPAAVSRCGITFRSTASTSSRSG